MPEQLKNILGVVVLAVVLIGGLILWRDSRAAIRYERDMGALQSLVDAHAAKIKAGNKLEKLLNASLSQAIKDRENLDKEIVDLKKAQSVLVSENAAYKDKLNTLPDDTIVTQLESRIGVGQAAKIAVSKFSLTRAGAENTLSIFSDQVRDSGLLKKEQGVVSQLTTKVVSLEGSIEDWTKKYGIKSEELTSSENARIKALETINSLNKKAFWDRVKHWGEGIGVGVVVVVALKVAKII